MHSIRFYIKLGGKTPCFSILNFCNWNFLVTHLRGKNKCGMKKARMPKKLTTILYTLFKEESNMKGDGHTARLGLCPH